MRANPESTGPALLLEARDLTFDGGTDEDAFTSLTVVTEDGEAFEAVAVGATRPMVAGAAGQIQRSQNPGSPREKSRAVKYKKASGEEAPDLAVLLEPRPPLVHGLEQQVTLIITNQGTAKATFIDLCVRAVGLIRGEATGDVIRGEYEGAALNREVVCFELPSRAELAPGESLKVVVTLRSSPDALQIVPPAVLLDVDVVSKQPDLKPQDNRGIFELPLLPAPDLAVELLSATQDSAGVTPRRARYEFRVSNVGTVTAENAEVFLAGINLKSTTYQLAGGAPVDFGELDGSGERPIPVGPLAAGEDKNLVVEGEPARPGEGTSLAARGVTADDANPENNTVPGETQPGPGPDYAVTILSQTVAFEDRDSATFLTLRTKAELTLTLPEGVTVEQVADAVLTTRHAGMGAVVTADSGTLGRCERDDELTTRCTFPAEAFFQVGKPPGKLLVEVREDLDPVTPPALAKVTLSVEGDGQNPALPNNFAEASQDMTRKGAVTVTRTSVSARTVTIRPGLVGNLITQRWRVHNAGPGTVRDVVFSISGRLRPLPEPAYAAFVQAPQVVAGADAGVTVTVNSSEDIITIAALPPGGEVVIEFVDVEGVLSVGAPRLDAPEGSNLLTGAAVVDPFLRLGSVFTPLSLAGQVVNLAVAVTAQRIELESRDGGRIPVRVTELQVWHKGSPGVDDPGPPVDDVVLTLRGSGVNLGGSLDRLFGSGGTASQVPVPGVTRPEAPANPNVLRAPLGRFEPGQTNRYVLRDDVAEPDRDGLLGLSGEVTHPLFEEILNDNVFSSDSEYLGFQATLDYAVFIREQSVTTFLDPAPTPPLTVFALRTRFECTFSGSQGASGLPPMQLHLRLAGALLDIRLVPKDASIPAPPQTALQWRQDSPLSHEVTAEFDAVIARDYFLETISRAPAAPYQTVADLTGDGEVPAAGNNNRATRTVEDDLANFADVVVTGRDLFEPENPLLRFKEEVRTVFFVSNRSQSVAARNVRLTLGDRYRNPLTGEPGSLVRTVRIIGDNLPAGTADCLRAGNGGDCLLGEIPPGATIPLVVITRFELLPTAEENHPFQILLDFRAQADNEVNYFNNDQTVTYPTRIPVVDIEQVVREGDEINVLFRLLRPSAVPTDGLLLECSGQLIGPWVPCETPLPIRDDTRFVRPRGY